METLKKAVRWTLAKTGAFTATLRPETQMVFLMVGLWGTVIALVVISALLLWWAL
jgi:hypothetical protein